MIQFRFSPRKALQAVEWMLVEAGEAVDFHTLLKTVYFADKRMLNEFGRPIFGATYRAMNFGPVPLEVYEMAKCEPLWLAELELDEYPWTRSGYKVSRAKGRNAKADLDDIAPAEMDILRDAFAMSRAMTFNQRTRETHGMDWVEGSRRKGAAMAYEDMIDATRHDREELIADLEAIGPRLVL
jgi:hypothetical protein